MSPALLWFKYYVFNNVSAVLANEAISSPSHITVTCGVPRRSVIGSLLYYVHILLLSKIITSFSDITYHIYADDIQLYVKLLIRLQS